MKDITQMDDGQFYQWAQNEVLSAETPEKVRKKVTQILKAQDRRREAQASQKIDALLEDEPV